MRGRFSVAKMILGLCMLFVGLLAIVVNYSEASTDWMCQRAGERDGQYSAYMSLNEYRFWVHLWSASDGNATILFSEINTTVYVPTINRLSEGITTNYFFLGPARTDQRGRFRLADGRFQFSATDNYLYIGNCRRQ
jgi:hypothetical protein